MLKIKVEKTLKNFIKVSGNGLTQQDLFDMACQLDQAVYMTEDSLLCEIDKDTGKIIHNIICTNHDIDDYQSYFINDEKCTKTIYTLYE